MAWNNVVIMTSDNDINSHQLISKSNHSKQRPKMFTGTENSFWLKKILPKIQIKM